MLKIITQPNPILRLPSQEIPPGEIIDDKIQQLIKEMILTMQLANGIGLAAPQVSQSLRLTVIERKFADQVDKILTLINPQITKKSLRKVLGEEGCLSIPGYFGLVKRHKSMTIKYFDANGRPQQLKANDLLARVIQHEIDHLDGILFTDKATKIYQLHNG